MRTTFVNTLLAIAKEQSNVMLLTGDLGFTVFEMFRDTLPNQYLNAGIAEQNMMSVAAGLAMNERIVFVYSIVPFATFRCLEQIRNDICYHRLPVCIVGVGGGYSYGHMGSTHHAIEDIAVMRALPGMTVVCPGDPLEVGAAVKGVIDRKQPCYLRLGKAGEPTLHDPPVFSFSIGKAVVMHEGKDIAIIATGNMLETAKNAADLVRQHGQSVRLLSMHTVKPIDTEAIISAARETQLIVTIEEHSAIGGLGSAVAQVLSALPTHPQQIIFATPDAFAPVTGSQQYLRQKAGLTPDVIAEKILKQRSANDLSPSL